MIILMSIVDGMTFEVEESVAFVSPRIRLTVELLHNNTVALPIYSYLLPKIIEYLRRHVDPGADAAAGLVANGNLESMDAEFNELNHMEFDRIILFCRHHVDDAAAVALADGNPANIDNVAAQAVESFDADFVNVDASTLLDLLLAANYLKVRSLEDLICQAMITNFGGL